MQDLNDLYYFAEVVDHGGFAAAGRAIGVPKSKLSRRIALLENGLGVRLIQRSTRRFAVTDVGRTYYAHCKAMLVEAQSAQEAIELTRAEPCGVVRISCPVALLDAQVAAMLAAFMAKYPRVVMHLEATNRRVDVVAEAMDVAIRVRPPPLEDSDLVLRVLADRGQCLVASPQLLQRFGTPNVPADLTSLPSLDLGAALDDHAWHLVGPDGAAATIQHQPRFVTGDLFALRTAAVAGVGVVQLPTMLIKGEFSRGELVRLLPAWAPPPEIIHAVFASRRGVLPSVRALIDYLVEQFRDLDAD